MRQTELALAALQAARPGHCFEVLPITTTGDDQLSWSLEKSGGKGLFTSALEERILAGEADLAVHSAKDLPTVLPDGLVLAGYLPRAAAHDRIVLREDLGPAAPRTIATGSPRRRAQLQQRFPYAQWTEIRGNVGTRLQKIADGYADATVMAAAGLARLGIDQWPGLRFVDLETAACVPAAGQGAIGLQCRAGQERFFAAVGCEATRWAVDLERAILAAMGGGCHSATAVHCSAGKLHFFDTKTGYRSLPVAPEQGVDEAAGLLEHLLRAD